MEEGSDFDPDHVSDSDLSDDEGSGSDYDYRSDVEEVAASPLKVTPHSTPSKPMPVVKQEKEETETETQDQDQGQGAKRKIGMFDDVFPEATLEATTKAAVAAKATAAAKSVTTPEPKGGAEGNKQAPGAPKKKRKKKETDKADKDEKKKKKKKAKKAATKADPKTPPAKMPLPPPIKRVKPSQAAPAKRLTVAQYQEIIAKKDEEIADLEMKLERMTEMNRDLCESMVNVTSHNA